MKQNLPPKPGTPPYRREKFPSRNELCPCGSGKKAKRCCLPKIKYLASLPPELREAVVANKIMGGALMRPVLVGPPPTGPEVTGVQVLCLF